MPEELEGEALHAFLDHYWLGTAAGLTSGDLCGLAMLTEEDFVASGLESPALDPDLEDDEFGALHHSLRTVDPDASERLAGYATQNGLVRPHMRGGRRVKPAPQPLRSVLYREERDQD